MFDKKNEDSSALRDVAILLAVAAGAIWTVRQNQVWLELADDLKNEVEATRRSSETIVGAIGRLEAKLDAVATIALHDAPSHQTSPRAAKSSSSSTSRKSKNSAENSEAEAA